MMKFWCFLALFVEYVYCSSIAPASVPMKVMNRVGHPIDVFWMDDSRRSPTLIKTNTRPIRNNSDTIINTYASHKFVIKELGRSHSVNFTKGPSDETITVYLDQQSNTLQIMKTAKDTEIQKKVETTIKQCSSFQGDKLTNCLANGLVDDILKIEEQKSLAEQHLARTAHRLRNYTCLDDNREAPKPISTYQTNLMGKPYDVNVILNMDAAKVWYVDNFITEEECDMFLRHGKPLLRRATVAAEDGTSIVSENRKAQQASYDLHWKNPGRDPLWNLSQRILQIANNHAGYNLTSEGQEGYTIIQYNIGDQYMPHCDAACDGLPHTKGGRIATALMYCKAPIRGGQTVFTKTDIVVKPKVGATTFFSYKGSDGRMDEGAYTEHSSCPVLEGEKWAITFWMREGVSKEEPWDIFDPEGVKILKTDEYVQADETFVDDEGDIIPVSGSFDAHFYDM